MLMVPTKGDRSLTPNRPAGVGAIAVAMRLAPLQRRERCSSGKGIDEPSGNGVLNGIPVTVIEDQARFKAAQSV